MRSGWSPGWSTYTATLACCVLWQGSPIGKCCYCTLPLLFTVVVLLLCGAVGPTATHPAYRTVCCCGTDPTAQCLARPESARQQHPPHTHVHWTRCMFSDWHLRLLPLPVARRLITSKVCRCACCSPPPLYLLLVFHCYVATLRPDWALIFRTRLVFVWESFVKPQRTRAELRSRRPRRVTLSSCRAPPACCSLAQQSINHLLASPAATARSRRTKTFTYQVSTEIAALRA